MPLMEEGVAEFLSSAAREFPRLALAASWLKLSPIDIAALLITLAPDVDLRYEKIYGYLQDDISRKRPAIDLIANLLATDIEQRLVVCGRFNPDSPLIKAKVLESLGTPDTPWLARPWCVDELWRNWLLGRDELDATLACCARLMVPRALTLDETAEPETLEQLRKLLSKVTANEARHDAPRTARLRLLLQGSHGAGKFALTQALAHESGLRLLVVDARGWSSTAEVRAQVQRACRAAALMGALAYLHGTESLAHREPQLLRALVESLSSMQAWFVLSLAGPLPSLHADALRAIHLEVGFPSSPRRQGLWTRALMANRITSKPTDIERVAACFTLSLAQIEQAAEDLASQAEIDARPKLSYADLEMAARAQCGAELALLARRINPRADFSALVAPTEVLAQLREICARVATRDRVRTEWGGGSVHSRSLGVTALFAGSSGTGKTLAAEALAHELGLDLYRIDLACIVSKYIGETEKNLDRVFAAAENANAVLFFDEADALFGKRSEVKDAHDRYANIEIAYLLQKMEQFDGLAILATNLKQNLDEAFMRRLTFTVNFPFPGEAERLRLWETLWPLRAPRAADVDLAWFAHEFRLSGGNIRNTVLAAAHLAAADGQVVTHEHLMHATRREYQKLGKNLALPSGEHRA